MSEMLYLQTEKNTLIEQERVCLSDAATVSCADPKIGERCRRIVVCTLPKNRAGRYVLKASDLIRSVSEHEPNVEVTHIGEPTFILTYETGRKPKQWMNMTKTILLCVISFVGAGFSIMTFNTDVDTSGLFRDVYQLFTGQISDGFTILEIAYSIGIGVGAIFFFNHFGRWKVTQDPTPMEVEMRMYEDNIDMTIMEQNERESHR